MKKRIIAYLFLIGTLIANAQQPVKIPATDINKFFIVSNEAAEYRKTRMVSIEQFNKLAREGNTIILDSRSKVAFKKSHIRDAINLNFSDFTEQKLATVLPNKTARILIYCNNNFESKLPELLEQQARLL